MPKYFSTLLIGPPGSGKTTAAATAPGPILFLDCDNKLHKMDNLKDKLAQGKIIQWAITDPLSEVTLKRLVSFDPKPGSKEVQPRPKGYLSLADMVDKLVTTGCIIDHNGAKVKIETVVLDSYTSMNEHLKRLLTASNGTTTMSPALYGVALINFETLNNTLLRLPTNVIFICHEKVDKDELTGKITFTPLIDGQMKDKIGKDFEEVYYMEKTVIGDTPKYEMLTVGNSMKSCRTSRILPAKVETDFSKIYK